MEYLFTYGGHMGSHASIRGVLAMDLIPEFLWKYMDVPEDNPRLTGTVQKNDTTDNQLLRS